jgi:Kef-type K+ transport system membrane component KefB/glycine cleavage system regulatory protein
VDAALILFRLVALLVAAQLALLVASRLRVPAVLAEITAGVLLGPSLLGIVGNDLSLKFLGELGAIFLLMEVGLHMDLADLFRVGRAAMQVAVVGVVVPLVAGLFAMRAIGISGPVALFLAAGITATSVGITARVFADMRALATVEAQTVLGAAVADDVIGLLILTVVTRLSLNGHVEVSSVIAITVTGVAFVIAATGVGSWLAPFVFDRFISRARTEGTLIGAAVAFTIALAGLAAAARLAPIVGAFVAGVALGRIEQREDLRRRLAPVVHLFVPVFFLLIGAEARVNALAQPGALLIVGVLGVIAVGGKVVAGLAVPRRSANRLVIGVGMIPRGEVGLVFATLGLSSGVLKAREHAALLLVVLATTIVAPPWLRRRIERGRRAAAAHAAANEPDDGWLGADADEVELRAEPPLGLAARIGLDAALLCAHRRPGPKLLEWLSNAPDEPPTWDADLRRRFLSLLRDGNPRSWRLLDVTGLLAVLIPEIDAAMRRRKLDPFDLDPSGALRWDSVEAVNELVRRPDDPTAALWANVDQDAVLVAALGRSAFHGTDAPAAARRLAATLGLDEVETATVEFLTAERALLPAAASRLAMGTEESVLELAAHIGNRANADALYLLAAAETDDPTQREALDELHALISAALAHPELVGAEAADLVETRKRAAIAALPRIPDPVARRLVDAAPRRYLLVHSPDTIARHGHMLEPWPSRNEVRLFAEPSDLESSEWWVHLVAIDRPGALAAITRAFSSCGIPITEAWISTWSNGALVDVFRAAAPRDTDWSTVRDAAAAMLAAGERNGGPTPIAGRLDFDNVASPWHTIVEVRAEDRAGLLHRVAEAFARAGVQIHHATVRTIDGVAVDTFLVTDRHGHKLDEQGERALRAAFAGKPSGRWTPRRLLKKPGASSRS